MTCALHVARLGQRTRIYVWGGSGSTLNLPFTSEASTDGLKTRSTAWSHGAALTNQNTTVYAGSGTRYTTNIAPDHSYIVTAYK